MIEIYINCKVGLQTQPQSLSRFLAHISKEDSHHYQPAKVELSNRLTVKKTDAATK